MGKLPRTNDAQPGRSVWSAFLTDQTGHASTAYAIGFTVLTLLAVAAIGLDCLVFARIMQTIIDQIEFGCEIG